MDIRDIQTLNDQQLNQLIEEATKEKKRRRKNEADNCIVQLTTFVTEILERGFDVYFNDECGNGISLESSSNKWWIEIRP